MKDAAEQFGRLYTIMGRLRGPGGCPWDIEQTPQSVRQNLIEETYECVEAINESDSAHVKEEIGDIYLVVTMIAYMYEQAGDFTLSGVLDGLCEKLIRRHPHVFGETTVKDSAEVLENWAKIKVEQEGRKPKDSALDSVSRALPPLDRAWKLQKKAAKLGFDWPSLDGALSKVNEELAEVQETRASGEASRTEEELGDLLFAVVNLCRHLKVEPSVALQRANAKFTARFSHVEKRMRETGAAMTAETLPQMDEFWNEAKSLGRL